MIPFSDQRKMTCFVGERIPWAMLTSIATTLTTNAAVMG